MRIELNRKGSVAMLWPRYCGRNANITTRPLPCFTSTIAPLFAIFSPPSSQPDNRSSFALENQAITFALSLVGSNARLPSTHAILSSLRKSSTGAPLVMGLVCRFKLKNRTGTVEVLSGYPFKDVLYRDAEMVDGKL